MSRVQNRNSGKNAKGSASIELSSANKTDNSIKSEQKQKTKKKAVEIMNPDGSITEVRDNAKLKEERKLKEAIEKLVRITHQPEVAVALALHEHDYNEQETICYLTDPNAKQPEWTTYTGKKKNRKTENEDDKLQSEGNNGLEDKKGQPSQRGLRSNRRGKSNPGGRHYSGREVGDTGDGGNGRYNSQYAARNVRGGRGQNGPLRGIGRSRGNTGRYGYHNRTDEYNNSFPSEMDTWNSNDAAYRLGDFPPTDDWDNEEYTGSLTETQIFMPSVSRHSEPPVVENGLVEEECTFNTMVVDNTRLSYEQAQFFSTLNQDNVGADDTGGGMQNYSAANSATSTPVKKTQPPQSYAAAMASHLPVSQPPPQQPLQPAPPPLLAKAPSVPPLSRGLGGVGSLEFTPSYAANSSVGNSYQSLVNGIGSGGSDLMRGIQSRPQPMGVMDSVKNVEVEEPPISLTSGNADATMEAAMRLLDQQFSSLEFACSQTATSAGIASISNSFDSTGADDMDTQMTQLPPRSISTVTYGASGNNAASGGSGPIIKELAKSNDRSVISKSATEDRLDQPNSPYKTKVSESGGSVLSGSAASFMSSSTLSRSLNSDQRNIVVSGSGDDDSNSSQQQATHRDSFGGVGTIEFTPQSSQATYQGHGSSSFANPSSVVSSESPLSPFSSIPTFIPQTAVANGLQLPTSNAIPVVNYYSNETTRSHQPTAPSTSNVVTLAGSGGSSGYLGSAGGTPSINISLGNALTSVTGGGGGGVSISGGSGGSTPVVVQTPPLHNSSMYHGSSNLYQPTPHHGIFPNLIPHYQQGGANSLSQPAFLGSPQYGATPHFHGALGTALPLAGPHSTLPNHHRDLHVYGSHGNTSAQDVTSVTVTTATSGPNVTSSSPITTSKITNSTGTGTAYEQFLKDFQSGKASGAGGGSGGTLHTFTPSVPGFPTAGGFIMSQGGLHPPPGAPVYHHPSYYQANTYEDMQFMQQRNPMPPPHLTTPAGYLDFPPGNVAASVAHSTARTPSETTRSALHSSGAEPTSAVRFANPRGDSNVSPSSAIAGNAPTQQLHGRYDHPDMYGRMVDERLVLSGPPPQPSLGPPPPGPHQPPILNTPAGPQMYYVYNPNGYHHQYPPLFTPAAAMGGGQNPPLGPSSLAAGMPLFPPRMHSGYGPPVATFELGQGGNANPIGVNEFIGGKTAGSSTQVTQQHAKGPPPGILMGGNAPEHQPSSGNMYSKSSTKSYERGNYQGSGGGPGNNSSYGGNSGGPCPTTYNSSSGGSSGPSYNSGTSFNGNNGPPFNNGPTSTHSGGAPHVGHSQYSHHQMYQGGGSNVGNSGSSSGAHQGQPLHMASGGHHQESGNGPSDGRNTSGPSGPMNSSGTGGGYYMGGGGPSGGRSGNYR